MRPRVWTLGIVLWLVACGDPAEERTAPAPDSGAPEAEPEPDPEPQPSRAYEIAGLDTPQTQAARERLVRWGVERRGVRDEATLRAMSRVPRHLFVPPPKRPYAYENRPLPIGWDQTISQPYVVASMTEELGLGRDSRVLEIGTGSGYQAAVLAEITPHVYTIEIKKPLAERAAKTFAELGYPEIEARCADGYYGWPDKGPFDAIIVTAAAPHVPPPLVRQLKPGGRMIIPVGRPLAIQDLVLVRKDEKGRVRTRSLYEVRFVPLTGSLGETTD